jgi:hypothetical protein
MSTPNEPDSIEGAAAPEGPAPSRPLPAVVRLAIAAVFGAILAALASYFLRKMGF